MIKTKAYYDVKKKGRKKIWKMSCSSSSVEYIRKVGGVTNDEIDNFF